MWGRCYICGEQKKIVKRNKHGLICSRCRKMYKQCTECERLTQSINAAGLCKLCVERQIATNLSR